MQLISNGQMDTQANSGRFTNGGWEGCTKVTPSLFATRACSRRPAKENSAKGLIKELASLALAKMA